MNRRNLIKGAAALPLVAFDDPNDGPDGVRLLPFQQEMWDDHHKHPFNLFILPRGGGKSWMANVLDDSRDSSASIYDDPDDVTISILKRRPFYKEDYGPKLNDRFSTTIITSVNHPEMLKEMVDSKRWNVRHYGYRDLGIIFDEQFVNSARKKMPTKEFDRQFNSML